MQEILAAHQIPSRIVDKGFVSYFGQGSSSYLQVLARDRWTALLLLSPVDEDQA